jgi:3-deoxy-manno-octulosonate cytidylyltransferase (CMP-KDO synthetase)
MIQWVCERVRQASLVDEVVVATDDNRIFEAVSSFGVRVMITESNLPSGTDRVAAVVRELARQETTPDLVINVQGDEPLIDPAAINQLVELCQQDAAFEMGTLCCPLNKEDALDPARVKVVFGHNGDALYFSRSPIPYPREQSREQYFLHLGIYAYSMDVLQRFVRLPEGHLEKIEKLEQLRALENGIRIRVGLTEYRGFGVDTPEDVPKMEALLRELQVSG